jgi:NADH:ubiquinone oxidoreductase subunit 6 (subunit J)
VNWQTASELVEFGLIAMVIAFAIGTAGMKNLLYAALALGAMCIVLCALYWAMYAPYVGLFQMLVYGGAVVVLFVSVIMFVKGEGNE